MNEPTIIENQIKNLRRKIVQYIWDISPKKIVAIAIFLDIKVPKGLIDKLSSEE